MANYCDYTMKIKGTKRNCEEWVSLMSDYDKDNHFHRFFSADVYNKYGNEDNYTMLICGDCAWSLETCCRASGYSNGIDLFAENTSALNIVMEAWSQEPGFAFQEHYIYDNGDCLTADCVDWNEWYWDKNEFPTYQEFKDEFPEIPPEDEFEDGYAYTGGFGGDYETWSI